MHVGTGCRHARLAGPFGRRAASGGGLALLLLLAGCGPGQPLHWDLRADVRRPQPGAVLFIVDGLPPRFVEQGCREGWLPNLQRRFVGGGAHVAHATTTVPAITYSAITSLLTGTAPGTHGIVGNRWFDPDGLRFRNYATIEDYRAVNRDFSVPTIYERIAPAVSGSVQAAHRRGVTHNIANWAVSGTMWFFKDYTAVDKLTSSSVGRLAARANEDREWPHVVTFYYPGLDSVGHRFGPDSPQFRRAMEHADYQVGRVCDWLERQGLLETTYLALVSDHGMVPVNEHIDLLSIVNERWGRHSPELRKGEGPEHRRAAFYARCDTVVGYQDGRTVTLHFRGPDGWAAPPDPAEVTAILEAPAPEYRPWNLAGVELVAWLAGPDEAILRNDRGRSRVRRQVGPGGVAYAYVPDPEDVLDYLADPALAAFVAAGPHTAREWLGAARDARLPDVVPHLIPLLHVRRAGQVVLFARPGYSFVRERGGHGGLDRDEVRSTFLLAGPAIAPGTVIETAHATDLVPTLLELLGLRYANRAGLEGLSLAEAGLLSAPPHGRAGGRPLPPLCRGAPGANDDDQDWWSRSDRTADDLRPVVGGTQPDFRGDGR